MGACLAPADYGFINAHEHAHQAWQGLLAVLLDSGTPVRFGDIDIGIVDGLGTDLAALCAASELAWQVLPMRTRQLPLLEGMQVLPVHT